MSSLGTYNSSTPSNQEFFPQIDSSTFESVETTEVKTPDVFETKPDESVEDYGV